MNIKNFLAFSMLIFCAFCYGQGTLKGVVTDKDMGNEPLPFATIVIKGSTKGTTTDENGHYSISLSPGTYTVECSMIGFSTQSSKVTISKGKETVLNFVMVAEQISLDDVVVTADVIKRDGEKALLLEQKNAVIAKQAIGGEELSKKGISDAQGAVAKVSGISKQEGVKSVFVRGLGDRYNATTINSFPVPSEDAENKNISLDFFTTDIISSISVEKAFTVGNFSDVGGATIDITSKELSKSYELNLEASAGVNTQAMSTDFFKQDGVSAFGRSNKHKSFEGGGVFSFANKLEPEKKNFTPNTDFVISGGKKFEFSGDQKLSLYASASNSNSYTYTDEIIANTNSGGDIIKNQSGKKYTENIQQVGLLTAKLLQPNKNKYLFNFLAIHNNSQYVGFYEGMDSDRYQDAHDNSNLGFMVRQQSDDNLLLVNQLLSNIYLSDKSDIEVGVSYNYLDNDQPDIRVNNFSLVDPQSPYNATAGDGSHYRYFLNFNEDDLNLKALYNFRYNDKESDILTFGYRGRFVKDKFKAENYNILSLSRPHYDRASTTLDDLFNQQTLDQGKFRLTRFFDKYSVDKQMNSFLAEATYGFGSKFTANLGFNLEKVDISVDYNVNKGATKGSNKIDDFYFLPKLNLKYLLSEKQAFRLGLSKTYTLPQSKEISPYIYIDVNFKSQGNKDLSPSENYNLDLKWDYYISSGEILSLNGFYKHIKNPIARIEEGGSGGYLTYKNISPYVTISGIEMEFRKNLVNKDSENGSQNLSLGLNASYTFSELELSVVNTKKRTSKLEGAAPFLVNTDLTYTLKHKERKYNAALVFNYFSDRIYTIGTLGYKDIIEKGVPTLNFVSSADLTKRLSLKFKIGNIIDVNREYTREATGKDDKIILGSYKKGTDIGLGLAYKF